MVRQSLLKLVVISGCMVLVSCATMKPPLPEEEKVDVVPVITEPAGWAAEKRKRQQLNMWEIRGRLGVQTATNGGSMDIIWKQSNDEYSIRLIAPMGAGTHLIQGNSQYAEIRYSDGSTRYVDNIEEVLSYVLDVDLPASAIKDWVRGIPASSLPVDRISWNEQGLPERIWQSGWNVEMNKYLGNAMLLPHAIYVSRENNDKLDVRLALRQWLIDN